MIFKLDIKEYLCSYEESISMIKEGINCYTRSELFALINNEGTFSGITNLIRNRFCSTNVDDFGNVYLYDELDPEKITAYILNNSKYQIQKELAYSCVCYAMQRKINAFYKELALYEKNGGINLKFPKKTFVLKEEIYLDKYKKVMDARITTGYKRIRRE